MSVPGETESGAGERARKTRACGHSGCVQSRDGLGFSVVLKGGQVYMEKGRKKEKLGSPPCCADGVNPSALEISLGRAKRELVEDKVDTHLHGAGEGKTF